MDAGCGTTDDFSVILDRVRGNAYSRKDSENLTWMVCACRENIIRFCSKGVYQVNNSQITRGQ